ncbi:MAG: hypothetical protein IJ366_08160, partial [Clostridia bacterium]|nr:hypothetical protein [Clostridia bacterium]
TVDVSDIEELQPEAEYSYYFVNTNDAKQVFPSMQNLPEKILVTNYVYNRKTVPLKVRLEKDEEKYQLNVKELSVNETDIGIPDGFDEEIGELTIKFSAEKYKEGQEEYTLDVTVPDGVYLPEASKTVTVKIELVRLEKSDVRLDVEVRNVDSGLKAEVFPNNVTLTVREKEGADAKDKLKAYVDASGLKEGNYELEVKTDSVDGVIVDEIAHVDVTVSK